MSHTTDAAKDEDAGGRRRYLYVRVPRCPQCDSTRLKPYKTITQGSSTTRYLRCLDCGQKIIGVYE